LAYLGIEARHPSQIVDVVLVSAANEILGFALYICQITIGLALFSVSGRLEKLVVNPLAFQFKLGISPI
jgi:hypothetical protein